MRGLIIIDMDMNRSLHKYQKNNLKKSIISHNDMIGGSIPKSYRVIDTTSDTISDTTNDTTINSYISFTYNDIIDLLIKAQKMRYHHPKLDLACRINTKIKDEYPEIYHIIARIYDHILESNDLEKIKTNGNYDTVKIYYSHQIGAGDNLFDDDFEYHQIKQILGPIHNSHFMFKEHDMIIRQRGGFDFNKNKIKFKKQSDPKMKIICELYKIPCNLVKYDQLKYYHTMAKKKAYSFEISHMLNNITEYDYITPLIKLSDYHSENNYYSKLLKRNDLQLKRAVNEKKRLNLIDDISPNDRDSIMLQYLKCRKNIYAITLWRPGMAAIDKLVNFLEKNGEVYYIKTINLTKNGLTNLMYSYYDEFSYGMAQNFIEKKLEYVGATENNNPVCFILFDNTLNKRISGQGAPFKKYLRNLILEYADMDGGDNSKYRGNDMMHINDYFYQTIEYSQIILNENTINFMNKQQSKNYQLDDFSESNLKMQTLRNILYKSMSLLEIDRLITVGGTIFYAYGVRAFNDVDAILIDNQPNDSTHLIQLVDKYFSHKGTKFYFLDAGIQGSTMWNESWTKKDAKILNFLGIEDFKDLVLDPKNHFYFQGIKMATLEYEMLRKLIRNRTEDHVDFIMLNLLYPQIIEDYVTLKDYVESNIDNKETNNSQYFIINNKYSDIAGIFDDRFPRSKLKILKRRYTIDQIKNVQNDVRFKSFFDRIS
jgi:hypothetical protein